MGREATKAVGNPWFEARKEAAKYDGRLSSREGAAELLGMSVSSVADAELELSKTMPVDKAVLMADLYNSPQLLNHYCLQECPIGCRHSISENVEDIDRITVKLLKALKSDELEKIKNKLLDIAEDGILSEDDFPDLEDVMDYLDRVGKIVSELRITGEIALKGAKKHARQRKNCKRDYPNPQR